MVRRYTRLEAREVLCNGMGSNLSGQIEGGTAYDLTFFRKETGEEDALYHRDVCSDARSI